jgi:hypothetical protein
VALGVESREMPGVMPLSGSPRPQDLCPDALVGFQGRGVADGLHPDLCPSLLLEALIFQWS